MVTLRVKWPANPQPELVTHYQILENFNGGAYGVAAEVPATPDPEQHYDKVSPSAGQWGFKVVARNLAGTGTESDPVVSPGTPSKVGQPSLEVIVT